MQSLSNAVGTGQTNARGDVALIQAALGLITNASGTTYHTGTIDGAHGPATQGAINAFQADHTADVPHIAAGVVMSEGATPVAIRAVLTANGRDLRVLAQGNALSISPARLLMPQLRPVPCAPKPRSGPSSGPTSQM